MLVTLGDQHHLDGLVVLGELSRRSLVRSPKKVVLDFEFADPELENGYLLEST